MEVTRPQFVPDASLSREEMVAQQREIAESAAFSDDVAWVPSGDGQGEDVLDRGAKPQVPPADRTVAGVDQAFDGDEATSAVVVMHDGEVVERVSATEETGIPYIPGLLSFREGGAILSALDCLETDPDLLLVDGSGRIHYREAGLATHLGVALDVPAVGVAKSLLCGTPAEPLPESLPEGARVPIHADEEVTAPNGTTIGCALQTRQFESGNRYINPLYVSPGHRVGIETAASLVEAHVENYKLPEPIRRADAHAAELTA